MGPELQQTLRDLTARLEDRGCEVRPLVFRPPASDFWVRRTERRLGISLPPSFRLALTTISKHVEFLWFLAEDEELPAPFGGNFSGHLYWELGQLLKLEESRRGWVAEVFSDPADPYAAVWHNKLAFLEVGNGDLIALDLDPDTYEQVVYLSHDDGEGHGRVLAADFMDLLESWVPLGCPGGEDWQWLPFCAGPSGGIDPRSPNAASWRKLLGLAT